MRTVKLMTCLVVAVVLGWRGGMALAEEAYTAAGTAAAGGQTTWSTPGPERVVGQIIGIARASGANTLTVRVVEPNSQTQDMQVDLPDRIPISQGILAKSPSDLTVGTHVWLDYEQRNGKLVADEIGILEPSVPVRGTEGPDIRTG